MKYLPVSIDIEHETILIIGGGKLAIHKIESLEKFTQNIKVIALNVDDEVRTRAFVQVVEKAYEPTDLDGHLIVYAATNDAQLDAQIRCDARLYRCLVNVVDKPQNCDFLSPAVYQKDYMTVAVSSNRITSYNVCYTKLLR